MAFKKTLDLLQEKEKRLAELTSQSESAVEMVRKTMDNLTSVNDSIKQTVEEIDTYVQRLSETRDCLIQVTTCSPSTAMIFRFTTLKILSVSRELLILTIPKGLFCWCLLNAGSTPRPQE